MLSFNKRLRLLSIGSVSMAMTLAAGSNASAGPIALSDAPIFLTQGVEPNLMMAIDDSGSMDDEVLLRGNDGAAWWRAAAASGDCTSDTGQSFTGCSADGTKDIVSSGSLNFNNAGESNGTWKKYIYLFPNGWASSSTTYRRRYGDATNDHFAIPPFPQYGWSRSPDFNSAYFNPTALYEPWTDGGELTFDNADPAAARFDPVFGTATDAIDLTKDYAGTGSASTTASCEAGAGGLPGMADHYFFRVHTGMTIPTGTCIGERFTETKADGTTNYVDVWGLVKEVKATPCAIGSTCTVPCVVGSTCTLESTSGSGSTITRMIPDNTGVSIRYFPATFYLLAKLPSEYGFIDSAIGNDGRGPNGETLYRYEIKPSNFSDTEKYKAALQNFANWFTYYRKRHQALRAGLGEAFKTISGMRVGGFRINDYNATVTMKDIDTDANRTALYKSFYNDWTGTGGTPNREAVANLIKNYQRTTDPMPIQYACQKNFGMLFTDGFSNLGGGFSGIGNLDKDAGSPFADAVSDTMADGVMGAYATNLRKDLEAGQVAVPKACDNPSPPLAMDCNRDPHMNFYAVTLGTRGVAFDPDKDQDPYANPPTWPTKFFWRHPSAVDDIWHATINGRGKLLNAKTPKEISKKLAEVLNAVQEETASASTVAVSSGSIRTNTQVFQAKFNPEKWTGHLLGYKVLSDGTLLLNPKDPESDPDPAKPLSPWDAAQAIPGSRSIFTMLSNGNGASFEWTSSIDADTVRKGELGATDAEVQDVIAYVRGSNAKEGVGTGKYRVRESLLGDIINSSPLYIGRPSFSYDATFPDKGYTDFRREQRERPDTVYVGANDGMLHAFDATDKGKELFAYVPGAVVKNLKNLTSHTYDQSHRYFVDGPPNMGDAYFSNKWHTVLVGGLNKGGQAIYALDVTDPKTFGSSDVMWEFTHKDLGYTYSQPAVVRLHNGDWAAIFGNGYNSSEDDGSQGTGKAMLFIVKISDGSLIKVIDTGAGSADTPNGLATPTVVDNNGDEIADYVYAGDLLGNVWKFDLTDTSDANWKVAYSGTPLHVAMDAASNRQPITSRIDVARGPAGAGMVLLYGTGKFLEVSDRPTTSAQTFYGIYDSNTGTATDTSEGRTGLGEQEVLAEVAETGRLTARVMSSKDPGTRGWFLDLLEADNSAIGERVIADPRYREGRVIFSTIIPTSDLCDSGGDSWIMELDALTGKALPVSPVDINRDGAIDAADLVTYNAGQVSAGGFKSDVGIVNGVGIVADPSNPVEFKYMAGSKGTLQTVRERSNAKSRGRQSWRVVR